MKTGSIQQSITFNTAPEIMYNLLMDAKRHAVLTGSKATMSKKVGGKFKVFDGYCHGYNIKLIKGKRIVQAWHFKEDGWPDDHFSVCTFQLKPIGAKTKLIFSQTNVPNHKVDSLTKGWKEYYWQPMKTYLAGI